MNENEDESRTLQFEETTMGQTRPDELSPISRPPARPGVRAWFIEGLRAGFLLRPRLPLGDARMAADASPATGHSSPTPVQLIVVLVLVSLINMGLGRLTVEGPALFSYRPWLASWWESAAMLLIMWWALTAVRKQLRSDKEAGEQAGRPASGGAGHGSTVAAWYTLWAAATLPASAASVLVSMAESRGWLPQAMQGASWLAWAVGILLFAWSVGAAARVAARFVSGRAYLAVVCAAIALVYGAASTEVVPGPWQPDPEAAATPEEPRLELSQQMFLSQEALWQKTAQELPPQRPGVTDVYGIVFAPYAREDVFMRESAMVADVIGKRFDAAGRVVQLVNNNATTQNLAWATPLNLERAITAAAARMDLENDVLLVYLTSHGASDFKLSADHWPLTVEQVTPAMLRQALDRAGIRNRVIAVSACYSGGWVEPLAGDGTLVMTAADATHTSYGCGRLSPLTFFGRAVFDEQLRKTHSFEQAFDAAVPIIRQREIDGKKTDGFSNPQIRVGASIRPLLDGLAQKLDAQSR